MVAQITFEMELPQVWETLNGLSERRRKLDERVKALVVRGERDGSALDNLVTARARTAEAERIVRHAFFSATRTEAEIDAEFRATMAELDELIDLAQGDHFAYPVPR